MQTPSYNNNSTDSECYDVCNDLRQFNQSGTGVRNIGVQVGEELVKVKLNKQLITTNNNDMMASSSSSSSSSCCGVEDDDCVDGVVEREGAKINEIECGTFAHGFGLR